MTQDATKPLIDIPVSKLVPSRRNVRKSTPSKESHKELVAGIRTVGLLHPLIVIENNEPGFYEVIAGARRLKAIQELVKEGHYPETVSVLCRVRQETDGDIEKISLMENVQRERMHPADEFEAFTKMQKAGKKVADIANELGIPESLVYKRLRLGSVATPIIKAYRAGDLELSEVMAFTIEEDKKQQLEVFEELKAENRLVEWIIRRELRGADTSSNAPIAKFVGQKAYEKAGGAIATDLFQEVTYFLDDALLKKLAIEKLEKAREKLSGEWSWIEITLDSSGDDYKRLTAYDTDETPTLRQKLEALFDEQDALWDDDTDDPDDDKVQQIEEAISKAEEAVEDSKSFRAEEQALAGAIVTISSTGAVEIRKGMIRKSDERALKNLTSNGDTSAPREKPPESNELSNALVADLTTYRLNIAKSWLAGNPAVAQDLLNYTICCDYFNDFYSAPLAISIEETNPAKSLTRADSNKCIENLQRAKEELPLEWLAVDSDADRFTAFCALNDDDKLDLVTYCVANALTIESIGHDPDSSAEVAIQRLNIPWHSEFKPTAENYFGRISKPMQIEHGSLFMPEEWAEEAKKRPKKQLAEDLEGIFTGEDMTMPVENRSAAMDWVPPGFDKSPKDK